MLSVALGRVVNMSVDIEDVKGGSEAKQRKSVFIGKGQDKDLKSLKKDADKPITKKRMSMSQALNPQMIAMLQNYATKVEKDKEFNH